MATLKLKHLVLYFISFVLLYFADVPGGALLSIAAWLQLCILIWKKDYTSKNQMLVFIYFLTLIPLLIFLGASGAFISIYLREGSLLLMAMSAALTFILCTATIVYTVLAAQHLSANTTIMLIYKNAFGEIKKNQRFVLCAGCFLLFIIILPLQMRQDFKISIAIILIHLFLNRKQIQGLIF